MTDFGVQIEPSFGFTFDRVAELAHLCRDTGFTSMWASDHFMLDPTDADRNCLDCWTLLTALAIEVKDIRIGSLVTCMSYRNPAVLAKIAASVDMISGGRLEFGVGAGWKDVEYEAYGIPFPPPGERVDRLIEGLEIIKRLWTQDRSTFDGSYYRVKDAVAAPKPVQKPHPPVLIGGSRPRMLRVMARFADAVNLVPTPDPDSYGEGLRRLEQACSEEGTDYERIRKTHFMTFIVGRTDADARRRLERVAAKDGLSADEYRARRPRAFIGSTHDASTLLRRYTDLGITQFMIVFPYGEENESMKMWGDEVAGRV